jgi:hypothetical protein|tara:strand:+ start:279 stop:512 length:234 start_codon:yes stop_codon:yes gene_type:complete
MDFGTEKQLRRLVEVTATIGLVRMSGQKPDKLKKYRNKLESFAFPEEINLNVFEDKEKPYVRHKGSFAHMIAPEDKE